MSQPTVAQKSPLVKAMTAGTYWWCACGLSKAQPFCDGSHTGTEFAPVQHVLTEAKTIAWCGCKQTKNAPCCDGSHARL
jgi:CDGSH-type Zn-finger protein